MSQRKQKPTRRIESPFALQIEDLQAVRAQQVIIAQQRHILSALEDSLYDFIQNRYGIDLKSENWELNVEAGTLTRMDDNGPTP